MNLSAKLGSASDNKRLQVFCKVGGALLLLPRPFLLKVSFRAGTDCWFWNGPTAKHPRYEHRYGIYDYRVAGARRCTTAHRFCYETLIGKIQPGLEIDHLCENKLCVNPAHLEPVTHQLNVLRGFARRKAGRA